jgi:hypothetical protein
MILSFVPMHLWNTNESCFFQLVLKYGYNFADAKFILLCNEQTQKQSYALNVSNNSPVSHIKEWKLEDIALAFIPTSILLALLIEKRLCIGVRLSIIAFKY